MSTALKIALTAALGGALASAHAAFSSGEDLLSVALAALGGAVAAVVALYVPPPASTRDRDVARAGRDYSGRY